MPPTYRPTADPLAPTGLRFELFVDDVAASVRFYQRTLGLTPSGDWSPDGYVRLHAGAVTIGVQHYGKLPTGHHFTPERLAHSRGVGVEIVIEVDDITTAYQACTRAAERHGGRTEPLRDQPWGLTDFRLIDPDGYYLRVTTHGH